MDTFSMGKGSFLTDWRVAGKENWIELNLTMDPFNVEFYHGKTFTTYYRAEKEEEIPGDQAILLSM